MAIIELSIKDTYAPKWGTYEAIREAIQNGLDEDIRGYKLSVEHRNGWLTIYNHSAQMTAEALLMGHTDKADNDELLGEHGEGLDVGILAGVRAGYDIKITTQTETWVPYIERSAHYNADVLKIRTRKLQKRQNGVTVAINVPEEEWEKAQDLFLRFARLDRNKHLVEIPEYGAIITDPEYAGRIYVKGIFVQHLPDLVYGYNLKGLKLDRDRRLVDDWDLKWTLANVHRLGIRYRPEKMKPAVYAMLRDDKKDTQGLRYNESSEVNEAVAAKWVEEHGEKAVPVRSTGESANVNELDYHGVFVNDTLKQLLSKTHVPTVEKVRAELANSAIKTYCWDDLTPEEQDHLEFAAHTLDSVISDDLAPILNQITVVDFHSQSLDGLTGDITGNIQVARRELESRKRALSVLVHEVAHVISKCPDGLSPHTEAIERLWSDIYWKDRADPGMLN